MDMEISFDKPKYDLNDRILNRLTTAQEDEDTTYETDTGTFDIEYDSVNIVDSSLELTRGDLVFDLTDSEIIVKLNAIFSKHPALVAKAKNLRNNDFCSEIETYFERYYGIKVNFKQILGEGGLEDVKKFIYLVSLGYVTGYNYVSQVPNSIKMFFLGPDDKVTQLITTNKGLTYKGLPIIRGVEAADLNSVCAKFFKTQLNNVVQNDDYNAFLMMDYFNFYCEDEVIESVELAEEKAELQDMTDTEIAKMLLSGEKDIASISGRGLGHNRVSRIAMLANVIDKRM